MSLIHPLKYGLNFAFESPVDFPTEYVRYFVGSEPEQTDFNGPLEQSANREIAAENEIIAILDLRDRPEASQIHRFALML